MARIAKIEVTVTNPISSACLNATDFDQPHWRVIAQGLDTEKWFSGGEGIGTGGILMPAATRLPSGQYYYRFASSASSKAAQLGGGWWLDFEGYNTVRQFAERNGYRLREAARLMLALPYDWTKVDLLVKALLRSPLRAYTGEGKPAQGAARGADRGTTWVPTQHVKVRQIYIPGLFVKGRTEQIYEKAFVQTSVTPL